MLSGGLVIAGSSAASAHAVLEHTSPANGAVLARQPSQVTLTFGEDVGVDSEDIQVFDDKLHRVDEGDGGHITGQGATVGVRLPPHLKDGTYTVTWRVISADSHPVSGGFTFSIGHPSKVTGRLAGLGGGHKSTGIALGTMRFLGYLALVAGPGGLIFLLLWPAGAKVRRQRRMIAAGIAVGIVATAGTFLIQAPYSQGAALAHVVDSSLLDGVATSHFGRVIAIRFALWVLAAIATALWLRGVRAAQWFVGVVILALPVTYAEAGHGGVGANVALSVVSESLHVLAAVAWLGGLLVIATCLLRRASDEDLFDILPRFSRLALVCVGLILLTGLFQAWREVGLSWTALVTTSYGRLVSAKFLGLVALIGLGAFARWSLRSASSSPPGMSDLPLRRRVIRAHLTQSVFLELEIGVVVLLLTSVLVNTLPAKEAVDDTVHRTLTADGLVVDVEVSPGRVGPDTITLTTFTSTRHPQPLTSASGSLDLPARNIFSLPVEFATVRGSNRATASAAFPVAGAWQLTFEVQTSPINAVQFTTSFAAH